MTTNATATPTAGQPIASCAPFVSALRESWKSFRCDRCFRPSKSLQSCPNCDHFWYCGQQCAADDLLVHRLECGTNALQLAREKCTESRISDESDWVKFLDPDEYVTHTQLALRIIARLTLEPGVGQIGHPLPNGTAVRLDDVDAPACERMHKVWKNDIDFDLVDEVCYNFGAWLTLVREVLASQAVAERIGAVHEPIIIRAFRIVVRYAVYVNDMTFINEVGKAIYVELCFVEHSCVPNCVPLFADDNTLSLRVLPAAGVTNFADLRYDFQIEMAGYSAKELRDSLLMRDIDCRCKRCSNPDAYSENCHTNLTKANAKYGNWPFYDYCRYMRRPIGDLAENFEALYGECHPWVTALLLWKFRVEVGLIDSNQEIESRFESALETLAKLKKAISVTHGSDHKWLAYLCSIEEYWKSENSDVDVDVDMDMDDNDEMETKRRRISDDFSVDDVLNRIVERRIFERKLF